MKNTITGLLLLLSIPIGFTSCVKKLSNSWTFKNGSQWIPADYEPNNSILLVQTFNLSKKSNQRMEDYLAQKYPYKYEVVDKSVIEGKSGKYANTKIYRYALMWTTVSHLAPGGKYNNHDGEGNFYDRATGKSYPKTGKTINMGDYADQPVINTIIKYFKAN